MAEVSTMHMDSYAKKFGWKIFYDFVSWKTEIGSLLNEH